MAQQSETLQSEIDDDNDDEISELTRDKNRSNRQLSVDKSQQCCQRYDSPYNVGLKWS